MSPAEPPCNEHERRIERSETILEDQHEVLRDIRDNHLKHILARLTALDVRAAVSCNNLWWIKVITAVVGAGVLVLLGIKADLRW